MPYEKFTDILKVNGYEEDLEKVNEDMVRGNNIILCASIIYRITS